MDEEVHTVREHATMLLYTQCLSCFAINYYHPITGSYTAGINASIVQLNTKTRSTTKPQNFAQRYVQTTKTDVKVAPNSLSFNPRMILPNLIKTYHKMPPVQRREQKIRAVM